MIEPSPRTQPVPPAGRSVLRPAPLVLLDLQETHASVVEALEGEPIRLQHHAAGRINPLDPAQWRSGSADR